MSRILVVPLARLEETLAAHRPSHLVSLLSPEHMIATPAGFDGRHLRLGVNDVTDPGEGTHPPSPAHVEALLDFARDWDGAAPMVIHCWAGISRSMAASFTVLCDRLAGTPEAAIASAMRRRAAHAAPNALLVSHADAALGRDGRMVAALGEMGPAVMIDEGVIAEFPLTGL